jgi:hypothetical protein
MIPSELPVSKSLFASMPRLAGSRIPLKLRHLHKRARILAPSGHPCDASCEKVPPHASQKLNRQAQPIENEWLKTSCL